MWEVLGSVLSDEVEEEEEEETRRGRVLRNILEITQVKKGGHGLSGYIIYAHTVCWPFANDWAGS